MAETHFLSPFVPLIDAMLEDEGVELYVHYLDGVAYIKDGAGIEYPLLGVEWGVTAEEQIVSGIRHAISAGDDTYVHAGRRFRFRLLENGIIELRCLDAES